MKDNFNESEVPEKEIEVESSKCEVIVTNNPKEKMSPKKSSWILASVSWAALIILAIFCIVSNFVDFSGVIAYIFGCICMPIFIVAGIAGHTIAKRNKENGCKVQYWITFPSLFIIVPIFITIVILKKFVPALFKGIKDNM